MKTLRLLALLVAAAMFLVACQTAAPVDDEPAVTTGTLVVNVNTAATITVRNSSGDVVDTATNVTTRTWTGVPAGSYTVEAAAAGFVSQTAATVLAAGGANTLSISLMPAAAVVGTVGGIAIDSLVDVDGNDYHTEDEVNLIGEKALLTVAQSEEMVYVGVLVTTPSGAPARNVPVTVNAEGQFYSLAVIPNAVSPASGSTAIVTDDDGMAYFGLYATYGEDGHTPTGATQSNGHATFDPMKIVVSAVGSAGSNASAEFKIVFLNMTHLIYGPGGELQKTGTGAAEKLNTAFLAPTRMGHTFDKRINVWNVTPGATNAYEVVTFAAPKQPNSPNVAYSMPMFMGGDMVYTMASIPMDGTTRMVSWAGDCVVKPATPAVCTVETGGKATLLPAASVSLEDLPLEVAVNATYVAVFSYGGTTYRFPLKNYNYTKEWVGGYVSITKEVANNVLTWAGPAVTMAAYNDAGVGGTTAATLTTLAPFRTTYTITVENDSNAPVYRAVITDRLPAELGVIVKASDLTVTSSTGLIGTYNATNHTISWNWSQNAVLEVLDVGETIVVDFEVYARQKPDYKWGDGTYTGVVPRLISTSDFYVHPYAVTNGQYANSVVVSALLAPDNSLTTEQWFYIPEADESTIYVVRPWYVIEKKLLTTSSSLVINDEARWSLSVKLGTVAQHDAARIYPNPLMSYATLVTTYPTEFGGGANRDNPYARGVAIADAWEQPEMQFNNVTAFTGGPASLASTFTQPERVTWATGTHFGRSQSLSAQIGLDGIEVGTWNNCLFVKADNLNQVSGSDSSVPSGVTIPTGFTWVGTRSTSEALVDCTPATFNPLTAASLSLTPKFEYSTANRDPNDLTSNLTPFVTSGSDIVYKAEITSLPNRSPATGVTIVVSITDGSIAWKTGATVQKLYLAPSLTSAYPSGASYYGVVSGSTVTFTVPSIAAGTKLMMVLEATSNGTAAVVVRYTVNSVSPGGTLVADESTTLVP
jgi:hypothetical protein